MIDINPNAEMLYDFLGLTKQRADELSDLIAKDWKGMVNVIADKISAGMKSGAFKIELGNEFEIFAMYLKHAKTPQEIAFCSYFAGKDAVELKNKIDCLQKEMLSEALKTAFGI